MRDDRERLLDVLEANQWNRNVTAETLGINRTTLYKKMKRLALDNFQPAASSGPAAPAPPS